MPRAIWKGAITFGLGAVGKPKPIAGNDEGGGFIASRSPFISSIGVHPCSSRAGAGMGRSAGYWMSLTSSSISPVPLPGPIPSLRTSIFAFPKLMSRHVGRPVARR